MQKDTLKQRHCQVAVLGKLKKCTLGQPVENERIGKGTSPSLNTTCLNV